MISDRELPTDRPNGDICPPKAIVDISLFLSFLFLFSPGRAAAQNAKRLRSLATHVCPSVRSLPPGRQRYVSAAALMVKLTITADADADANSFSSIFSISDGWMAAAVRTDGRTPSYGAVGVR